MELQLGLALPTHNPIEGFDPNSPGLIKSKQIQIESLESWTPSCCYENKKHVNNKRSFEESFGNLIKKPLPLLVWSGQPNEEDDSSGNMHRHFHTSNK